MVAKKISILCQACFVLICFFYAHASQTQNKTATTAETLLKADGTLDLSKGYNGSLDAAGWRMVHGNNGEPRFIRATSPEPSIDLPARTVVGSDTGYWDGRFSFPGLGVNDYVMAIAVSGSDVYVGGKFTRAGDIQANRIAKWNGSRWSTLGSGVNGVVNSIAVSGSLVYAGGGFTQAGDVLANRIAKWDGTRWSPLGSGIDGPVYAVAVRDSSVYAGGLFAHAGGVQANNIARWDGSTWSSLGSGVDNQVNGIAVSAQNVYAGGAFKKSGEVDVNWIATWDGNQWSALGSGVNNAVTSVACRDDNVFVGGFFSKADTVGAKSVARWDGTKWHPMGNELTNDVYTLTTDRSNVYVGGFGIRIGGADAHHVAKWDGNQWSFLGNGVDWIVSAVATVDGHVYVGGKFQQAGGLPSSYFGCWHEKGLAPEFVVESPSGLAGANFVFRPKVSGLPMPNVSLVSGPAGMAYDAQSGTVRWTPYASQCGSHPFTLQAVNASGTVQQTFMVWVDTFPRDIKTHANNRVRLSVFNDGIVGTRAGADMSEKDVGFEFMGSNALFEGNLVIGKSASQVSGGLFIREFGTATPVVPIPSYLNGFDQAFETRFNDQRALNPIGVSIVQRSNSKSTDPDRDYVVLDYWIKNTTGSELTGIFGGLAMDWDVGDGQINLGGYNAAHKLNYMFESGGASNPNYYGMSALVGNVSGSSIWLNGSGDNDDGVLFDRMTHVGEEYPGVPYDRREMLSVGPYTIRAGDSVRCVFAVLGGRHLDELKANADTAAAAFAVKQSWSVALNVTGDNGISMTRTFGGDPKGTDGFDAGMDMLSPPVPQTYFSCFRIASFPYFLTTDVRRWEPPFLGAVDWTFAVFNGDGISATLSWNPSDLPVQGTFTLVGAGNVNMRTARSIAFTGTQTFAVQYRSAPASAVYRFNRAGWHMVSLNVVPRDSSVNTLFPGALGNKALVWDPANQSYAETTRMAPGKAYWIALSGPVTCTVAGAPLSRFTSRCAVPGWYMIGSVTGNVDFSNPEDNPDGQALSPAFVWDPTASAYFSTTALAEKEGYWIAIAGACDLTIGGSSGGLGKASVPMDWDSFHRQYGNNPPDHPNIDFTGIGRFSAPSEYALHQNFPNPFNPETRFLYSLPEAAEVRLAIYDTRGTVVFEHREGRREAGNHTVVWNASGCPSGMYVAEFTAGRFRQIRKCVLLK